MSYRVECDTVEELRALLSPALPVATKPPGIAGLADRPFEQDSSGIARAVALTARELGITPDELARARRPKVSDIASLARPVPEFEDDPLAAEKGADGEALTDKARADFAAATAPPVGESS